MGSPFHLPKPHYNRIVIKPSRSERQRPLESRASTVRHGGKTAAFLSAALVSKKVQTDIRSLPKEI
jgi:hypothetical protein